MNSSRPELQDGQELRELQRLMARAVTRPLTRNDSMQREWLDGRPTREIAESFIKPNDRLDSFERLEIYNRQYWFRIRDCFYDDFPGLRAVLGDRKFERLADIYLAQFPSRSFTLRNLGSSIVPFLETNPKLTAPRSLLALDMARLEWAHVEAFDNEAKPRLEMDSLAGADSTAVYLALQPYLRLLELDYELDELLIKLKHGDSLRSEASNAMAPRRVGRHRELKKHLRPKRILLAVHRNNETVHYKRLNLAQFRLLSAFKAEATLAQACEVLVDFPEVDATEIKNWFETWAALGWFCKAERVSADLLSWKR